MVDIAAELSTTISWGKDHYFNTQLGELPPLPP